MPPLCKPSSAGSRILCCRHEAAELTLRTKKPVAFDAINEITSTGRFVIVDAFDVAAGRDRAGQLPRRTPTRCTEPQHLWTRAGSPGAAGVAPRPRRRVVWLTGLSCSGKSTIATELERELSRAASSPMSWTATTCATLVRRLGFSPRDRRAEHPPHWRDGQALATRHDLHHGLLSPYQANGRPPARACRRPIVEVY